VTVAMMTPMMMMTMTLAFGRFLAALGCCCGGWSVSLRSPIFRTMTMTTTTMMSSMFATTATRLSLAGGGLVLVFWGAPTQPSFHLFGIAMIRAAGVVIVVVVLGIVACCGGTAIGDDNLLWHGSRRRRHVLVVASSGRSSTAATSATVHGSRGGGSWHGSCGVFVVWFRSSAIGRMDYPFHFKFHGGWWWWLLLLQLLLRRQSIVHNTSSSSGSIIAIGIAIVFGRVVAVAVAVAVAAYFVVHSLLLLPLFRDSCYHAAGIYWMTDSHN